MSVEDDDTEGAPKARRAVTLGGLLSATGWVSLALAAASAVGQRVWPLELIVHFWPQLGIALLLAGLGSALAGSLKAATAQVLGAVILLVYVGASLIGASSPAGSAFTRPGPSSPDLRAVFANVGRWNVHHERLIEVVRRVRPDIIGLAEIDDAWLESLSVLADEYPFRSVAPRDDNFGVGLLSRFPLSNTAVESLGRADLPSILATVETPTGAWRVIVTHPVPPFHAAAFASRNIVMAGIAARVRTDGPPTVVLADLNATPWSPYVRDLRHNAGLNSSASGLRARYTWPAGFPPLALELDHCLFSDRAAAVGHRVLDGIGSDHFPILCELVRRR